MAHAPAVLSPRKLPAQARSVATLDAICEAAIQVLLAVGTEKLTTTRVAERAGVSVGSLYQYFPNKQSLLSTVLQRHLVKVVEAVEDALGQLQGATLAEIASGLVNSFFQAKLRDRDASAALYAVSAHVGGEAVVKELTLRSQKAVADTLNTASDGHIADVRLASLVVCGCLIAPVQQVLASGMKEARATKVQHQLILMISAYLTVIAQ
jgi:AcrR family transcriptional regulator